MTLWTSTAIGALVSVSVLAGICVLGGMHKLLCLGVSLWLLAKKFWNGIAGRRWWWLDPNKLSSSVLVQTHRDLSERAILLATDRLARAKPPACHLCTAALFSAEPISHCLGRSAMRGRHRRDLQPRGKREAFSQQWRQ